MKKFILSILAVSAIMFTSCKEEEVSGKKEETKSAAKFEVSKEAKAEVVKIVADFVHLKEGHVEMLGDKIHTDAKTDMLAWEKEAKRIGTLTETNAVKGEEGRLVEENGKKRFVNAKGVETSQLVAKGLIGAYQLNGFNANALSAYSAVNTQGRVDGLAKAVAYLLGNYDPAAKPKTGDEFKAEGNSFGKYMAKYGVEEKAIYAAIKEAKENADDEVKFIAALTKLNANVTTVVAKRAVHYMYGYGEKIKTDWKAKNVHELSEGLGFAYSLQFAYKEGGYYLTADEAKAIVDVNLWDYSKVKGGLLKTESERIAKMFGFDVTKA